MRVCSTLQNRSKSAALTTFFVCTTFGLFTDGLEKFDAYYEKGYISKVITTDLTYRTPELVSRPWYEPAGDEQIYGKASSIRLTTTYPLQKYSLRQRKSISCWQNTDNRFCVRRMHTAKNGSVFPGPFLMLSILFSILFSDQGRECREVSLFSLRCTWEYRNPGCSRCRGSADESASPALPAARRI